MVSSTKSIFVVTKFSETEHEKLKPTRFVHDNGIEAAKVLSFNSFLVQAGPNWNFRMNIDGFKVHVDKKRNPLILLLI